MYCLRLTNASWSTSTAGKAALNCSVQDSKLLVTILCDISKMGLQNKTILSHDEYDLTSKETVLLETPPADKHSKNFLTTVQYRIPNSVSLDKLNNFLNIFLLLFLYVPFCA